jgi:5-methylthioadenosine/S-adenosylhomocysteine deaminase
MTQQVDLLVTGLVVTMNENFDIFVEGAVAVDKGAIVAVGTAADLNGRYQPRESRHYQAQAIIPGLVNAHTHVPMTLLRGLNDDLRLDVWLGYLMPLEREFVTPEFVRLGTAVACAEMIRSGITTFADMYYFEDDIAAETAAIGMRALLGQTLLVFPAPDAESYEDSLVLCRRFIEKWNGHELIQPAVAPHAWYTATPELLRACADLARLMMCRYIPTSVKRPWRLTTAAGSIICRSSPGMPAMACWKRSCWPPTAFTWIEASCMICTRPAPALPTVPPAT